MIDLRCMACSSTLVKQTNETSGQHKCSHCGSVQALISLGKRFIGEDKRAIDKGRVGVV